MTAVADPPTLSTASAESQAIKCASCTRLFVPEDDQLEPTTCTACEWTSLQTDGYAAEQSENVLERLVDAVTPVLSDNDVKRVVLETLDRNENPGRDKVTTIERLKVLGAQRRDYLNLDPLMKLSDDEADALSESVFEYLHKEKPDTDRPVGPLVSYAQDVTARLMRMQHVTAFLPAAEAGELPVAMIDGHLLDVLALGERWLLGALDGVRDDTEDARGWQTKLGACRKLIERVTATIEHVRVETGVDR